VKILDFGIAKIKRPGGTGKTMQTQAGLIMGSPAYMSPEQCKDTADVDLRSDIYSFATIIYEMLAGQTPYIASSGTEMLIMHLTATPAPVREFAADVPAHVEAAIKRALSRSRDDRFESMASFMAALRGEAGTGVLERPSLSDEMPVAQASAVPDSERAAAAPSITTFSRATGEMRPVSQYDMLLQASRSRHWPLYAGGGAAVVGLMLFLLLRPSHEAAPQATAATLKVAAPEAAAVLAPQQASRDAGLAAPVVVPSKPASVAAAAVVPGARPSARVVHAGAPNRRHGPAAKETFPQFKRPVAAPSSSYSPAPATTRQDEPAGF
jgi:serine/threonine-protein kinase